MSDGIDSKIGYLTAITGSVLLAMNAGLALYGFIAFLFSNVAWIHYSIRIKSADLLKQNLGFVITTILGILTAVGLVNIQDVIAFYFI